MYYNLAAYFGSEKGLENRDKMSDKMTSQDISKAQEMAREWLAEYEKRTK